MLRIKLVKSVIAHTPRNRATVKALGLRKTHSVVEHEDTPTIRGMIHHVKHLLEVTVVEGEPMKKQSPFERPKDRSKVKAKPAKKAAAPKVEAAPAPKPEAAKAEAKAAVKPAAAPKAAKAEAKPKAETKPKAAAKPAAKPAAKAAPKKK